MGAGTAFCASSIYDLDACIVWELMVFARHSTSFGTQTLIASKFSLSRGPGRRRAGDNR